MADNELTTMTRIGTKALEAARMARISTGERLMDYITRVVLEAANRDLDEWQKKRSKEKK